MAHELWLAKDNTLTNITPIIGNLAWRSNIDELSVELSFNLAHSDAKLFPKNPCDVGDMVILKNGSFEITRGIIVNETKNGRSPISYKAFDMAFYLNKSKRMYQFKSVTATQAITRICKENNIPIHAIASMKTKIKETYVSETLSDIIKDILEKVNKDQSTKYRFEMRFGKFHVYKVIDMVINPKIRLAPNLSEFETTQALSNPARTRQIEDMRNRIHLVSDNKLITQVSDDKLIKKYGLLSEIVDVNKDDISKAKNIARNTLKELGRVFEEGSVEMLGNDLVLAGRMMEIEEPITGMKGKYLINSVQHTASNGIHKMSVGLGVI